MKTLQGTLEGIVLAVQLHEIAFTFVTLPKGIVWGIAFVHFCLITALSCSFSFSCISREPFNCIYINIFTDVFVITLRFTSLKKPINSIFPSVGSHFKVFLRRLIVWYAPLFLRMTPSHLLTFCTVDCCSTLILKVLRNASQQLSLCWSIWELNLGLEKRETFSWYIAWMPLYYCGVH